MKTSHPKTQTFMPTRMVLAAVGLGFALTARAQDFDMDSTLFEPLVQTHAFEISPFYGYRFGGEVEDVNTGDQYSFEDSNAFGLFVDYAPANYYGRFELLWSHQDSSLDFKGNYGIGSVDLSIDVVQFGGVVEFGKERLREYVSAHIGATHFSSDDYGDETKFSFGIGVGAKLFLTKNAYLRADLRGFCTVVESEGGFIYSNGVAVASFSGSGIWQGQATIGFGISF